jgi:hypothetical protein
LPICNLHYVADLLHIKISDLSSIFHRYSSNTGRSLTYIAKIEDKSLSVSWLGVPPGGRGDLYKRKGVEKKQSRKKVKIYFWLKQGQNISRKRAETSITIRLYSIDVGTVHIWKRKTR